MTLQILNRVIIKLRLYNYCLRVKFDDGIVSDMNVVQ